MRRIVGIAAALALAGIVGFWTLTRPEPFDPAGLDGLQGDASRGEQVFWAGGCAACHAAEDARGDNRLVLSGGLALVSDFGTFYAPNISPDPDFGIGGWSTAEFLGAMQNGVSPDGRHYFPAFPYASYRLAEVQDLLDLHAFLGTLPASRQENRPHDLGFPFSIRRLVGGWKLLFLADGYTIAGDLGGAAERGRYLAEALAHCGECHTPRNILGGLDRSRWLSGAPNPAGDGRIPNITPGALDWSADEIASYLRDGFTPEFDVAGGHMARVVLNLANLSDADRAAIAAYLQALPER